MLAFVSYLALFLSAEAGHAAGGFTEFYNKYLNYPGFELWKFINLAIFVLVMVYLLKRPLTEAFKAKREAIRAELIKAEEEKQAALAELVSAEARLASLPEEKKAVLAKAKAEADAERKRLAAQAASDITKIKEQAGGDINRLTQQTLAGLRRFSAEESVRLAEEKLRARIDPAGDARLVKSGIDAIGGLNQ
jgi:F0F1-type ATP synthase membrane subunit b/b'